MESFNEFPEVRKVSHSSVTSPAFSPNTDSIAIEDGDSRGSFRNLNSWRSTWSLPLADDWQQGPMLFSSDGAYFVSTGITQATGDTGTNESKPDINLYDTTTRRLVGRLLGQSSPVEVIEISQLGDYVATADVNGDILLWRSPFRIIDEQRLRFGRETVTALIEKSSDRGALRGRLYQQRAFLNARLEQWKAAVEDFLEAKNREPDDTMHWMRAGVMLLMVGDMARYREHTQWRWQSKREPPWQLKETANYACFRPSPLAIKKPFPGSLSSRLRTVKTPLGRCTFR